MKQIKTLSLSLLIALFGCEAPTKLSVEKVGNTLLISGTVGSTANDLEIQFHSIRNKQISSYQEVADANPEAEQVRTENAQKDWEIFYPIVDLSLRESMNGKVAFDTPIDSPYSVNGMFHAELFHLKAGKTVLPSEKLQQWENNFYVNNGTALMTSFYVSDFVSAPDGDLNLQYELLSSDWQGEVAILNADNGEELGRFPIAGENKNALMGSLSGYEKDDLSRERLLKSLKATAQFTMGSQDNSPTGLTRGGLNLFYDLEAKTYRRPTWVWGWGPSIKTLIEASKFPEITNEIPAEKLMNTAKEIGEASLQFQIKDESSPAYGVIISRWSENKGTLLENYGFEEYYSVADAQFLVGWGWIPLYQATGDIRYLEGARLMTEATGRLTQEFDLIPMDYMIRAEKWKNYALNEQGFATEGINELYRVDPNPEYQQIADDYMKMLFKKFDTESGIWNRLYRIELEKAEPTKYHTRGVGWAMEGLIAIYELTRDPMYLEKAIKMGNHLIENQLEDGSWSYDFKSQNPGEISEKGTALWSLLFYKLYGFTKDPEHLNTARKALMWCLNNQYDGEDMHAHGGVVGVSQQSGVVYRKWFPLACTYTSGFFGLAVLEELKIQENES